MDKSTELTEEQSLQVIREMITVSRTKLRNDGILFILWGWLFFLGYLANYVFSTAVTTHAFRQTMKWSGNLLALFAFLFTLYHVFYRRKRATTYISLSLRYVWLALLPCLVLVNLIQNNVVHEINFNLQHPIFMVFIAFAIFVTGGILRYGLVIAGGILFALLAYASSFLPLNEQMLLEAVAWLVAFVVPGHILHYNRKKHHHVQGT